MHPMSQTAPSCSGNCSTSMGRRWRFARQWCQTPDDVVQEAFLQLARQRTWPRSVVAWLYRVVRNGALRLPGPNSGAAGTRKPPGRGDRLGSRRPPQVPAKPKLRLRP